MVLHVIISKLLKQTNLQTCLYVLGFFLLVSACVWVSIIFSWAICNSTDHITLHTIYQWWFYNEYLFPVVVSSIISVPPWIYIYTIYIYNIYIYVCVCVCVCVYGCGCFKTFHIIRDVQYVLEILTSFCTLTACSILVQIQTPRVETPENIV